MVLCLAQTCLICSISFPTYGSSRPVSLAFWPELKTDPVTGQALETSQLIKLNFSKVGVDTRSVLRAELGRKHARPDHLQGVFPAHPYRLYQEHREHLLSNLAEFRATSLIWPRSSSWQLSLKHGVTWYRMSHSPERISSRSKIRRISPRGI